MSHKETVVMNKDVFIDTQYSSGDFNKMPNKPKQQYQEENNNEVDELSKDFSEMGCIVDSVKRPPNICVETCVYESESEHSGNENSQKNEEDYYSDNFEDDKSDEEIEPKLAKSETINRKEDQGPSDVKLSKSHSFMSSKTNVSVAGSKASTYGSITLPRTSRINMSFTNERLREIERHNHILLTKIMSARNSRKSSIPSPVPPPLNRPPPSASIFRKRQQRQIDHENMILLRKIQRAKSSACSIRR